jgi:hypothetical protein
MSDIRDTIITILQDRENEQAGAYMVRALLEFSLLSAEDDRYRAAEREYYRRLNENREQKTKNLMDLDRQFNEILSDRIVDRPDGA